MIYPNLFPLSVALLYSLSLSIVYNLNTLFTSSEVFILLLLKTESYLEHRNFDGQKWLPEN